MSRWRGVQPLCRLGRSRLKRGINESSELLRPKLCKQEPLCPLRAEHFLQVSDQSPCEDIGVRIAWSQMIICETNVDALDVDAKGFDVYVGRCRADNLRAVTHRCGEPRRRDGAEG